MAVIDFWLWLRDHMVYLHKSLWLANRVLGSRLYRSRVVVIESLFLLSEKKVFIFGHSRGDFIARSVGGMILKY